jgi:hypothetical protein
MLFLSVLVFTMRCTDAEAVPVRQIDNSAVLTAQLARLSKVRASRDDTAVAAALQAIEAAARSSERQPNLMELAVQVGPRISRSFCAAQQQQQQQTAMPSASLTPCVSKTKHLPLPQAHSAVNTNKRHGEAQNWLVCGYCVPCTTFGTAGVR